MRDIVSYEIMQVNPIDGKETFIEDELTYANALKTASELKEDNKTLGFKIVQVVRETLDEFLPLLDNKKLESTKHFVVQILKDRVNYEDFLTLSKDISENQAIDILHSIANLNQNITYRLIKKESTTTIV